MGRQLRPILIEEARCGPSALRLSVRGPFTTVGRILLVALFPEGEFRSERVWGGWRADRETWCCVCPVQYGYMHEVKHVVRRLAEHGLSFTLGGRT